GDDGNPGTPQEPKRTIAAALDAAQKPGTHVVIHSGTYYEGNFKVPNTGTSDAPLVIRGAEGEKVVILGSHEAALNSTWKDLGDGYFSFPFQGQTWLV